MNPSDPEYRSPLYQFDWWREQLESPCFVYVIQGDSDGPIKIGLAIDVPARIRGLQTGNPQRLRLLHVVPGDHALEREFHRRLEGSNVLGEWFHGPAVEGFLTWVTDYARRAIREYRSLGTLPEASPHLKKVNRRGLWGGAWDGHGKRTLWRTSTGPDQEPVTVRYVKPEPPPPVDPRELPDPNEFPELHAMILENRRASR